MSSAAPIDMSISGQFSRAGVDDASPGPEYTKITEGFAAVLFPPAKHGNRAAASETTTPPAAPKKECKLEIVSGTANNSTNYNKAGDACGFFINNEAAFEENQGDQAVFYNPAQVVNRDLTICVMETFSRQRRVEPFRKGGVGDKGITILEALSASGLRSIRYWKEITGLKYIVANDLDPDAVECMKRNLAYNTIPIGAATLTGNTPAAEWRGVVPNEDDAVVLMQRLGLDANSKLRQVGMKVVPPVKVCQGDRPTLVTAADEDNTTAASSSSTTPQPQLVPLLQAEKMDIVDLDPYGSASPFLDSAMQCIKEGGLMCITSTDSAILCGTYPETCHAKYNSIAIRHTACHEMAVRILLAAVERTANKHKKFIVPMLSLHIDFYVRIFIRVYTQQAEVKLAATKLAHYFKCTQCPNFSVTPLGRVRVHGKNNNNNDSTAGDATANANNNDRGGKKQNKKERKAAKREREDAAAAGAVAAAGSSSTATAAEEAIATTVEEVAAPAPVISHGPENPPAFIDYSRMPPNSFPAVHDRTKPFSVNPSTIRNVCYECAVCKGAMAIAGPIYAAPIHNTEFLETLDNVIVERHSENRLTATNRIRGLVLAAKEELPLSPMFVELPEIASLVKCRTPPLPEFVAAICRLGYKASQVHCNHSGLKSDAPVDVLVGLCMDYKRRFFANDTNGSAEENTNNNHDGRKIHVPAITGDFTYAREYDFSKRNNAAGIVKFVQNAPGWGPKARHCGVARDGAAAAEEEETPAPASE